MESRPARELCDCILVLGKKQMPRLILTSTLNDVMKLSDRVRKLASLGTGGKRGARTLYCHKS